MRLALLCASLEPGRDGVGDYVRRIASALAATGHECFAIALADPHVMTLVQESGDVPGLRILRVPRSLWNSGKLDAAVAALRAFSPEVVSLQMVAYGFHRRGLLWNAYRRLKAFHGPWVQHVMLHELWIGAATSATLRARVVGRVQRLLLLRFLRRWSAQEMHTSNEVYVELLRRCGIVAGELQLPGNIPVVPCSEATGARQSILHRLPADSRDREPLLAGVFGSVHAEMALWDWPLKLHQQCEAKGRRLVILHLGRNPPSSARNWEVLCQQYGRQIEFLALGAMSPANLSTMLRALDLGISANPLALTGKSGSVAAMREHGLPVCIVRDDFRLRAGQTPFPAPSGGLVRLDDRLIDRLAEVAAEARASADPLRALRRIESVFTALAGRRNLSGAK
jgi:hypothetical protein